MTSKTFTLWAPDATRVDVVIGPERFPMRKINDGWWSAEIPSAGPGTDYAFILDGGEPLPDPRYADFGTLADLAKALERVSSTMAAIRLFAGAAVDGRPPGSRAAFPWLSANP